MSSLREALWQARTQFNTEGAAPDFDQMVLLGHSMGGLLCHSLAVSSGDRFWQLHSDRPFQEILGPPEVLTELRQFLFFEPMPRKQLLDAANNRPTQPKLENISDFEN